MKLQQSYNICSFTKDMLLYKYFSRFLLRFVLQLSVKKFSKFYELLFPKNLLVAAANRFKVLKTFISLKVTVYIQDRRLRSEKALDAQGFEWKSNCTKIEKYTCDFKHKIYCNIYIYIHSKTWSNSLHSLECIQNPFQRLSKEVISLELTIFTKNLILYV